MLGESPANLGQAGPGGDSPSPAPGGGSASVAEQLAASRQELLDLTLRNPLVNFKASKAKGLRIVDEIPREVFRHLVEEGKSMSFLAAPEKTEASRPEGGAAASDEEMPPELRALVAQTAHEGEPAERHVDDKLQTAHVALRMETRLRNTFRHARSSIEEQGVNILYLALGTLVWYESKASEKAIRAPLVLVPAELSGGNVRARFKLRWTDEEIDANLSLDARLKRDFDIGLPELGEDEDLDVDAYFDRVAEAVAHRPRWRVDREAVHLGFFSFSKLLIYKDLDPEAGPAEDDPSDHPVVHALYGGGFQDEPSSIGDPEPPDGGPWLDERLGQDAPHQVVDSDSSQTLAVMDVVAGRNLVIQGPPGTGKSQTITNLIAEFVARGKRVLFVAEKMAALDVVKRRLDSVHLGNACLELHSHKANKKAVLDELKRTMELGKPRLDDPAGDKALLERSRDRLNEYSVAVNSPVAPSGLSPHQLVGRLDKAGGPTPSPGEPAIELADSAAWSFDDFRQRREDVLELQTLVERIGVPREHPYWGTALSLYLPADGPPIAAALDRAAEALAEHRQNVRRLASALGVDDEDAAGLDAAKTGVLLETARRASAAPPLAGWRRREREWTERSQEIENMARDALEFARIREKYGAVVIPEAWQAGGTGDPAAADAGLLRIRQRLAGNGGRWWSPLSRDYWRAAKGLRGLCRDAPPSGHREQVALLDALLAARRAHAAAGRSRALLERLLDGPDPGWDWETHQRIGETAQWLVRLHRDVAGGAVHACVHDVLGPGADMVELDGAAGACRRSSGALSKAFDEIAGLLKCDDARFSPGVPPAQRSFVEMRRWLDRARGAVDSVQDVVGFNSASKRLAGRGMESVAEAASAWKDAGRELVRVFERCCCSAWLQVAWKDRPVLSEFDGSDHESVAGRFRRLDKDLFLHNRALVAHTHWKGVPRRGGDGQLGVLFREFAKKRRHLPVRRLMTEAGNAVQAIKPVFMMSPLSIAKFVPRGAVRFDLAVFDEASQVRPAEALGAVVRADQTVVVGDSKQLPPTAFFERLAEDDDQEESATADLESVLGMFCAHGAPERMLRWHYRSRHESLVAVSNYKFYDGRLVVFPSPDKGREESGLRLLHGPESFYEPGGGGRVNPDEARAVARAVMAHAAESPELTLGVAAFSLSQARRIEDELEILRRRDASAEAFFTGMHPEEPFFVKNLENVQGDERDVVFISVGYGKTKDGRMRMNFGPLNKEGGERRLNVLITRARLRCVVHANFRAGDLDLRKSGAGGVAALKTFLHYAETGRIEAPRATGREADSPFEEAVASELRARGHDVVHQVGEAGFFVDLAVVDPARPGRYLLGIECDGATYHSARSARDRDRLRQQVLEGLGWTIHRIWSTDWFRRRGREVERVLEAIRRAAQAARPGERGHVQDERGGGPSGLGDAEDDNDARRSDAGARGWDAGPQGSDAGVRGAGIDARGSVAGAPDLAVAATRDLPRAAPEPQERRDPSEPYRMAEIAFDLGGREFHEVPLNELLDRLVEVVGAESPMNVDEAAARLAKTAGLRRTGSRIKASVLRAVQHGARTGRLVRKGEFLWRPDHDRIVVRRRDDVESDSLRWPGRIASEEIGEALRHVIRESHGIEDDEAVRAAVHLFKFNRLGKQMKARVQGVLDDLKAGGAIEVQGRFLHVRDEDPSR